MQIDISKQPRRDDEIKEAMDAVVKHLIQGPTTPLAAYYPTIIEALKELLKRRELERNAN